MEWRRGEKQRWWGLGFLNEAPGSRGPAMFETGFGGNGIKASYGVPELRNEASLSREILP